MTFLLLLLKSWKLGENEERFKNYLWLKSPWLATDNTEVIYKNN